MSKYFNDYSFLFQNSNSSPMNNMSWLSDYNSIKNGTYGKLVKAYYAKQKSDGTDTDSNSKTQGNKFKDENAKTLDQIQSSADSLSVAANKLTTKGTGNLFKEKEITTKAEDGTEIKTKDYDRDAIYSAVKQFADGYNNILTAGAKSDSNTILGETMRLTTQTRNYATQLSGVGITVGSDNKLSIDEDQFKKSDMTAVKSLFNGNTSFASLTSAKASMIGASAASEANRTKTYTNTGAYDNAYSAGNMMNSFF